MNFMKTWTPALALSLCVSAIPDAAEACDPSACGYADVWTSLEPLNAGLIPIDGVLLLQGTNSSGGFDWDTQISLEVTLAGQPVAGELEQLPLFQLYGWRPAQPLEPGATYKVTGAVDNPDDFDYCGEDIVLDFEFSADVAASAPLAVPMVNATEELVINPTWGLEALVCCEGVEPKILVEGCGDTTGFLLDYPEGACAAGEGVASLGVTFAVEAPPAMATAGLVMYEVLVAGEPVRRGLTPQLGYGDFAPFCSEVRVTNLATGESVTTPMQCHGDALADQVGEVTIDADATITCSEPLQTCEVNAAADGWNMNKCTPWPPGGDPDEPTSGEPTSGSESGNEGGGESGSESSEGSAGEDDLVGKGCACDGRGGGSDALALLALLGLTRARRRLPR